MSSSMSFAKGLAVSRLWFPHSECSGHCHLGAICAYMLLCPPCVVQWKLKLSEPS